MSRHEETSPISARIEADLKLLGRLDEFTKAAEGARYPTERQVLGLLKDNGLDPAIAARTEAALDQRDRNEKRAGLAEHRRITVKEMSLRGMPVRAIAEQLGYVVQLRASLGLPRSRRRQ